MTSPLAPRCRHCGGPTDAGRPYCDDCGCEEPGCQRANRGLGRTRCGFHNVRRAGPTVLLQVACGRCGRPAIIRSGMPWLCSRCRRLAAGSLSAETRAE